MSLIRLGVLAAGLAIWYPLNKQPSEYKNSTDRYALPQEIEVVNTKHQKMINPRDYVPKDELIKRIRTGKIPEEELHEFFSYWDKPNL